MATTDASERDLIADYEAGGLRSVATRAELARLKAAARSTATKNRRVNIRLSSVDLQDIQARALQEGMPYQTLIASSELICLFVKRDTGSIDDSQIATKRLKNLDEAGITDGKLHL